MTDTRDDPLAQAAIENFIAEHGVTKCPPGAAVLGESTPGWRRDAERNATRGAGKGKREQQTALEERWRESGKRSPSNAVLLPRNISSGLSAPYLVDGVHVSSAAFLKTKTWRDLRYRALVQYHARCHCCGRTEAHGVVINVDHIKPRSRCPELALNMNNLQILCEDCNRGKADWDETDWKKRRKLTMQRIRDGRWAATVPDLRE